MVSKMADLSFFRTIQMDQEPLIQMDQGHLTQEADHQVMDLISQEDQAMDLPIQMDKDQEVIQLTQADQEHPFLTLYPFLIILVCRTSTKTTLILTKK